MVKTLTTFAQATEIAKEFGDNHYLTKSMLIQNLNFEYSEYRSLINYQYDATINPAFGSYYEYHILDYKDILKTLLKKIYCLSGIREVTEEEKKPKTAILIWL